MNDDKGDLKDKIMCCILIGFVFAILVGVGFIVIDKVSRIDCIAIGFCYDKEGIYYSQNYSIFHYGDTKINCSNKENPMLLDAMI